MTNNFETTELDKQNAIIKSGKAGVVQDFIDWLRDERGLQFGQWSDVDGYDDQQFVPVYTDPHRMMADYFDIDLNKIEAERRAILDEIQRRNT